MAKKKEKSESGPRLRNRKATHDYHLIEKLECGIELAGTEVKSLRAGQGKIDEAYVRIHKGELYLIGANIAAYSHAGEAMQHDPARKRRLLAHKNQIAQLESYVRQKGKTIVPLAVYFKGGWAKCEIAVAEGKRHYDKREDIRKRDMQRDMKRAMRRRR